MSHELKAQYWIETPLAVEKAAEMMAGEQSSGTFVKLRDETDELKSRHGARIEAIKVLGNVANPSLPGARAPVGKGHQPYTQAKVTLSWPQANLDPGLPTLLATVAGNLFELNGFSGLRLIDLELPATFAAGLSGPKFGIEGTRRLCGVFDRPILGTIIKPSVGLSPQQTAERVKELIESGLDFIKDDELMGDPPHSPFEKRVEAVMSVINDFAQRTGKKPMFAFNLSGEIDQMRRRHDFLLKHGGTCAMASLKWVGVSGIQELVSFSEVPIHGHRNGWGLFSRSPAIGISYTVWQKIWRLAGVDHLHCNGLRNKFCESDESVKSSVAACLTPLSRPDDCAMPVISSGQWADQIPDTHKMVGGGDFMFLCGGGIVGHPAGAAAGVRSLLQAWESASRGITLGEFAVDHPELREALAFFGQKN